MSTSIIKIFRKNDETCEDVESIGYACPVCGEANRNFDELRYVLKNQNIETFCENCQAKLYTAWVESDIIVFSPLNTCGYCGEPKVPGTKCFGCDECIYGPGGEASEYCLGWSRMCCKCGYDYVIGQM